MSLPASHIPQDDTGLPAILGTSAVDKYGRELHYPEQVISSNYQGNYYPSGSTNFNVAPWDGYCLPHPLDGQHVLYSYHTRYMNGYDPSITAHLQEILRNIEHHWGPLGSRVAQQTDDRHHYHNFVVHQSQGHHPPIASHPPEIPVKTPNNPSLVSQTQGPPSSATQDDQQVIQSDSKHPYQSTFKNVIPEIPYEFFTHRPNVGHEGCEDLTHELVKNLQANSKKVRYAVGETRSKTRKRFSKLLVEHVKTKRLSSGETSRRFIRLLRHSEPWKVENARVTSRRFEALLEHVWHYHRLLREHFGENKAEVKPLQRQLSDWLWKTFDGPGESFPVMSYTHFNFEEAKFGPNQLLLIDFLTHPDVKSVENAHARLDYTAIHLILNYIGTELLRSKGIEGEKRCFQEMLKLIWAA